MYPSNVGTPQVVDNSGVGVSVDLNSSMDASAAIFRGNLEEAVRVLRKSIALLGPQAQLGPNGGEAVSCDASSLVVSDLVHKSPACHNVENVGVPRA